jgi:hypothetical protein
MGWKIRARGHCKHFAWLQNLGRGTLQENENTGFYSNVATVWPLSGLVGEEMATFSRSKEHFLTRHRQQRSKWTMKVPFTLRFWKAGRPLGLSFQSAAVPAKWTK